MVLVLAPSRRQLRRQVIQQGVEPAEDRDYALLIFKRWHWHQDSLQIIEEEGLYLGSGDVLVLGPPMSRDPNFLTYPVHFGGTSWLSSYQPASARTKITVSSAR